jgi:hypothetical protein
MMRHVGLTNSDGRSNFLRQAVVYTVRFRHDMSSNAYYVTTNGRVSDELKRIWNEMVVA